jgi:folate-binding protein YgfZ
VSDAVSHLVLESLHQDLGAQWTVDQGVRVPLGYGDESAEALEARRGCALWDGSASSMLEMLGEDRVRFLNGMVTAEISQLEAGSSGYGLFTTLKGRVLADLTAVVQSDRIWLRLPPGMAPSVREHMERFVVTDRVEIGILTDRVPLVLVGPLAEERLAAWLDTPGDLPGPGQHRPASLQGSEVRLLAESRLGAPGFSIWVPKSIVRDFVTGLLSHPMAPRPVGLAAMESLRVEAVVPRFGLEFDQQAFPQEAGLDDAVSYEKGCYLGQEIVARIHFRGGVHRGLRGLAPEGEVAAGEALFADSHQAGIVSSVAIDGSGRTIALGIIGNDFAAAGTALVTAAGCRVEVLELPGAGR